MLPNKDVVCNPFEWIMPELATHYTRAVSYTHLTLPTILLV